MLKIAAIAILAAWSPALPDIEQRNIGYECNEKTCTLSKDDFAWLVMQHREMSKYVRQCHATRET